MRKINLSHTVKPIYQITDLLNKAIKQCYENVFFFTHIGYSQWDVETRSNKH